MASVEKKIRSLREVREQLTMVSSHWLTACFTRRQGPQRILTPASDPQPEPDTSVYSQFSKVDAGFLAWDFRLVDGKGSEFAQISRAFRGIGREVRRQL